MLSPQTCTYIFSSQSTFFFYIRYVESRKWFLKFGLIDNIITYIIYTYIIYVIISYTVFQFKVTLPTNSFHYNSVFLCNVFKQEIACELGI